MTGTEQVDAAVGPMTRASARLLGRASRASRVSRGIGLIAVSAAAGQALALALSPVLTRLYDPTDFGLLGVFSAVVAVLSVVGTLRFELAVPLAHDDRTAIHLVVLGLVTNLAVTAILGITLAFTDGAVASLLEAPRLAPFLWWLLPATLLATGAQMLLSQWAVRTHDYGLIATQSLVHSVAQATAPIVLGAAGVGVGGLLVGTAAGQGASTVGFVRRFVAQASPDLRRLSVRLMVRTAWRYRAFPLVSSWSGLANSAGTAVPLLVLASLYGPLIAGLFVLTTRVVVAPVALFGSAVAQVYQGEAAGLVRRGTSDIRVLFRSTARRLAVTGTPLLLGLGLVSPWAFPVVFGSSWEQAGVYTACLVPMYAAQFVVAPLSQTLNILERQGLQLAWDVARLGVACASLVVPWWLGASATITVLLHGLAMAVMYGLLFLVSDRALGQVGGAA